MSNIQYLWLSSIDFDYLYKAVEAGEERRKRLVFIYSWRRPKEEDIHNKSDENSFKKKDKHSCH